MLKGHIYVMIHEYLVCLSMFTYMHYIKQYRLSFCYLLFQVLIIIVIIVIISFTPVQSAHYNMVPKELPLRCAWEAFNSYVIPLNVGRLNGFLSAQPP